MKFPRLYKATVQFSKAVVALNSLAYFSVFLWLSASLLDIKLPVGDIGRLHVGVANQVSRGSSVVATIPFKFDSSRECSALIRLSILDANGVWHGNVFSLDATPEMFKAAYTRSAGEFKFRLDIHQSVALGDAYLAGSASYTCRDNLTQKLIPLKLEFLGKFKVTE